MPASAGSSAAQVRQSLADLIEPVVTGAGYDLEDITVSAAGRKSLVRVVVDADGGVDLDAVADISRSISQTLDADLDAGGPLAGALAGSYVLEVSSPGVDRPLTEPRHWRRAIGRLVATEIRGRAATGRVLGTDDASVTLNVKGREQQVAWADLGRGKVQVEFNRKADSPKDGGK